MAAASIAAPTVIVGTLLKAGVPCPTVVLDDGRHIETSALPSTVRSGARLRIEGVTRHSFACQREVLAVLKLDILSN